MAALGLAASEHCPQMGSIVTALSRSIRRHHAEAVNLFPVLLCDAEEVDSGVLV